MSLRDLLPKRGRTNSQDQNSSQNVANVLIVRSDTNSEEILSTSQPFPDTVAHDKRHSRFRSFSGACISKDRSERRLSSLLTLKSPSRERRNSSANVPADLPSIEPRASHEDEEAQWEKRATLLAQKNARVELSTSPRRPTISRQISGARGDVSLAKRHTQPYN